MTSNFSLLTLDPTRAGVRGKTCLLPLPSRADRSAFHQPENSNIFLLAWIRINHYHITSKCSSRLSIPISSWLFQMSLPGPPIIKEQYDYSTLYAGPPYFAQQLSCAATPGLLAISCIIVPVIVSERDLWNIDIASAGITRSHTASYSSLSLPPPRSPMP